MRSPKLSEGVPVAKILCPFCPLCGEAPRFILSLAQAFCGNKDCSASCWNMTITASENKQHAAFIDMSSLNPEPGK